MMITEPTVTTSRSSYVAEENERPDLIESFASCVACTRCAVHALQNEVLQPMISSTFRRSATSWDTWGCICGKPSWT
eukprot:4318603-Pyramimonas_sp.AAC.1